MNANSWIVNEAVLLFFSRWRCSRRPSEPRLGEAFLAEPLLVLLAPSRLVGFGLRELVLRSRLRVVICQSLTRSRLVTHSHEGDYNERHSDHRHDDPRDHAGQRTALWFRAAPDVTPTSLSDSEPDLDLAVLLTDLVGRQGSVAGPRSTAPVVTSNLAVALAHEASLGCRLTPYPSRPDRERAWAPYSQAAD